MEKSYTRTRDFQISKDAMVEKLTSVLPHYAVVTPSESSSAIIEAVAMPSALIPLEFPFRVEVQPFRNHYSRVILTCLSPSTDKKEILAARLLFPAILKSLTTGAIYPERWTMDRMLQTHPQLPWCVGLGGVIGIIVGQLVESRYSIQNALCAGYTPGSGSGCGNYTAYYDIGMLLFILGIVAVVAAVAFVVVSRKNNSTSTNTSPPSGSGTQRDDPDSSSS